MDYEHGMIAAKNDDPEKCQDDHCSWKAIPGTNKCKMHGGIQILNKQNDLAVRNYKLQQWNERLNELATSPSIKSLRDEVGIARMTLEAILVKCKDANQLFLFSNKISDLLSKIEKLVVSCNRLEDKLGYTLDKTAIISITIQIVEIISKHVSEDVLDIISHQVAEIISDSGTTD